MSGGIDQDAIAATIYLLHSSSYTALAIALAFHLFDRPPGTVRRWDWAGCILVCWLIVTGSDAALSVWFSVARWIDRPDWMYYSWLPIVFRGLGVVGMVALVALYARGRVLWASLAAAALLMFLASPLGPFI